VKGEFVSNYKTLHPVISHKKILLQSELTNCTFFPYQKHLKKKISKKTSISIELALSQQIQPQIQQLLHFPPQHPFPPQHSLPDPAHSCHSLPPAPPVIVHNSM
jgi:hypothetical protein